MLEPATKNCMKMHEKTFKAPERRKRNNLQTILAKPS